MTAALITKEPIAPSVDQQDRARAMSLAAYLPLHLKGKVTKGGVINPGNEYPEEVIVANCAIIVAQAERWGFDPFVVAGESYSVHGRMGYQGKFIAALVNKFSGLNGGLRIIHHGDGDKMVAVVFGSRRELQVEDKSNLRKYLKDGDQEANTALELNDVKAIRITVADAKTDNDMWRKDPEQKIWYSGATKWARRYAPDVIAGAWTDDDVDRIVDAQFAPQKPSSTEPRIAATTLDEVTKKLTESTERSPETKTTETKAKDVPDLSEPAKYRVTVVKAFALAETPAKLSEALGAVEAWAKANPTKCPEEWDFIVDTIYKDRLDELNRKKK